MGNMGKGSMGKTAMGDEDTSRKEDKLRGLQGALEQKKDDLFTAASPTGDFHVAPLNQLVRALNLVLPLFGAAAYPAFTADQTDFPEDFTRQLAMVAKASEDYGGPAIDLGTMKSDRDLVMAAGALAALSKDRDFKDFLRSASSAAPRGVPVDTSKAAPGGTERSSMSDEDAMNLMASRA